MIPRIRNISVDCADPYGPATFWSQVLVLADPEGNEFCVLRNLDQHPEAP